MTPAGARLSANLGFLWKDLPLPDAIGLAAEAGFAAVECHQPFAFDASSVKAALAEAELSLVSLNVGLGDTAAGDFGLAAIPGRDAQARSLIDQAVDYASAVDCSFVSVVAGNSGRTDEAEGVYRENLSYAAERAASAGIGVLIEPLNDSMTPDYHLVRMADAVATVRAVGASNLFVMADTFHVMMMEGDLSSIDQHLDAVGHIQISGWPDRSEPDHGIPFGDWIPAVLAAHYPGSFGAEYNPQTTVEAGLGWMDDYKDPT